jgi:hypothetical protein
MNDFDFDSGIDWGYWLTVGIVVAPVAVGLAIAYFWL